MQFFVDGSPTGLFAQLDDGAAELTLSTLSVGQPHRQRRLPQRTTELLHQHLPEITHTVNKAATTIALTSSALPSVFGQPVTFTATVSVLAPGAGSPTGTIMFKDGATVIGHRAGQLGHGLSRRRSARPTCPSGSTRSRRPTR